ncbi:MAG: hypothetical protein ACJAS1_001786 [Oleiphilaceae bacterium]|jgi:hypothetical protein
MPDIAPAVTCINFLICDVQESTYQALYDQLCSLSIKAHNSMNITYRVELTQDERLYLEQLTSKGSHNSRVINSANILYG